MSFINPRTVVSIATQGRHGESEWVSSYKIQYTLDGINWVNYDNGRVWEGNTEDSGVVVNRLTESFLARAIRINP